MKNHTRIIVVFVLLLSILCSTAQAVETAMDNMINIDYSLTEGTAGRLYLPSINASVSLYLETDAWSRQKYTDLEDGACVFDCSNCVKSDIPNGWLTAFSDHRNQAFKNLPDVQVGDLAYVVNYGRVSNVLQCTSVTYGLNYSYWFELDDGTLPEEHPGYMMFTCAKERGQKGLFLSFWTDVTEEYSETALYAQ